MINRILNVDSYDLIPAALVLFLVGSFAFPAYNQMTYDANLTYVAEVEENFQKNKDLFNEYWYENGQSFDLVEFNEYNILPNMEGFPGGEGVSGTAINAYDCQNIFLSMTNNDVFIEIGNIKRLESFDKETEFVVSYNEKSFTCSFTYIDEKEVKRLNEKSTHVITYNTKTGESDLVVNGYEF